MLIWQRFVTDTAVLIIIIIIVINKNNNNSPLLLPDIEHSSVLVDFGGQAWSSIWLDPLPLFVKWIPRGARHPCAVLLTELLQNVVYHRTQMESWKKLLVS